MMGTTAVMMAWNCVRHFVGIFMENWLTAIVPWAVRLRNDAAVTLAHGVMIFVNSNSLVCSPARWPYI
jgi:hypothetical protein